MIQSIPKLLDISYSHQCFVEQRNPHKHSKRANAKQKAAFVKNRTVWNDEFFESLKLLRWIWPKIMKVAYISQEYA